MNKITNTLQQAQESINRLDAEVLLAHSIRQSREYLFAHSEEKISWKQKILFSHLLKRRAKGIPVAYLTGHKEFYGLDFFVNHHTLIPRPDTEVMVELVKTKLQTPNSKLLNHILIDIGTGSGCIPISIIKSLSNRTLSVFATDISKRALQIAKKNAKYHQVNIEFFHGDLLEPIVKSCQLSVVSDQQIVITANLPYLTQSQLSSEPSIQHEPHSALVAENNGLALYENLLCQLKKFVSCYMFHVTCFMEIDPSQTDAIKTLIQSLFPTATITVHPDLAGHDRVVQFTL